MQTKKIIIIGAGFAGLTAAKRLAKYRLGAEITLIDKKAHSDFLPLIPDCIGRGINSEFLIFDLQKFCQKNIINFIQAEVSSVDLEARNIYIKQRSYNYDYLLIASGSQTNYFANLDAQSYAYALNNVADVKKIVQNLDSNKFNNFIICGGGYTGIETASNLWLYFKKKGWSKKIIIVERTSGILGPLPEWMKSYVQDNLASMGIEILPNCVIEEVQKNQVKVSAKPIFEEAMLIWVPGVRTADYIQNLLIDKNPQGRIIVDEYLRVNPSCFCVGDTALFGSKIKFLRMAIQFALYEGNLAARNILRDIKGKKLKKFRPVDLGYLIPLANNKSCGVVFGINLKGLLPTVLHYVMCIYRSFSLNNRLGIICDLFKIKKSS
ncbi:MAG: FAD-dependent oxidoreductase [Candidatus Omnitrophota bacterium]